MLVSVIRRFQVCLYLGIAISVSDGLLVTIGSRVTILAFFMPNCSNLAFFKAFGMKILVWHFGIFLAFFGKCCKDFDIPEKMIQNFKADVTYQLQSGNCGGSSINNSNGLVDSDASLLL